MYRTKQIVMTLLTVMCMVVIFLFSADPANESSQKSLGIGYAIAEVFVSEFDTWEPQRQQEFVEGIEYPIRKGGHATEYAILGFLLIATLYSWNTNAHQRKWMWIAIALGSAILYATSDEIHQLFVPGRSCQVTDVLIDGIGALLGIVTFMVGRHLLNRLFPRTYFCDTLKEE